MSAAAVLAAWQDALAAEHRAIFGYDLLGPWLPADEQPSARRMQAAHQVLRDAVAQDIAAAGLPPVAPQADYPSLYPVSDAADALALAVRLEDGCAAAWRYLYLQAATSATPTSASPTSATLTSATPTTVAVTPKSVRSSAQDALTASAVRATHWRAIATPAHATIAFPGL